MFFGRTGAAFTSARVGCCGSEFIRGFQLVSVFFPPSVRPVYYVLLDWTVHEVH